MRVGGKHGDYGEEGETNELMSESYSRRSWKGIAIAFLVIGAVAAIVTLIVLYSGPPSPYYLEGTLTLSDVISGKYSPKTFASSVWAEDDSILYMNSSNLLSYNIRSNKSKTIIHEDTWEKGFDYSFYPSPSGKYILYSFNKTKIYRYSYNASFQVLSHYDEQPFRYNISHGWLLQFASWGKADQLVYVFENNIYYLKNFNSDAIQVTHDGESDIFNGVPDWVYEEEILSSDSAIWWSDDGEYFAFMKFNDTNVPDMHYMKYGSSDQYYPTVMDIKYPKPGYNNPEVSMFVYSTKNNQTYRVNVDDTGKLHYITGVAWANNSYLSVMWGPRNQNQSFVSICSKEGDSWKCSVNSKENSVGWLEPRVPHFSEDGARYFLISSNGGYKHIFMNVVQNSNLSIFLTSGKYEVTDLVYYDNANSTLYYIRTDEEGAEKRRLFRQTDIPATTGNGECLSCKEGCDWASVSVSPSGNYYALTCSSPTSVHTVELFSFQNNTLIKTWETNQDLKDKLKNQTLCKYEDYSTPVNLSVPGGEKIKIRVWVPTNFSKSRKYPALIYVYGGPGSQMIQNTFGIDFGTYLVTNKNYLYVEVDGRGSGYRGDNLLYSLYKNLGTVEIQDQIAAMRFLLGNVSIVDPNRVAIWGWSYGGYAAAMTLAQGKDIFTCAMSVAPVTSWRYYDSVYTERYMLEPKDNLKSYQTSELMNYVNQFKNKPYLLLHGTADDNVHIQQSMMLTSALNNASILFDMHVYPDENHSIPKSKLHVYMTLEEFLTTCFA